jgi:tetratricopeptide (TPR) repeat protein
VLRERWPASDLADEGQLLTAQAWVLEKRLDEAQRAFQALLEGRPKPELRARALEGQAGLAAEAGKFDRALALYEQALEGHPRPDTLRLAIDKVKARRERARPSAPGDRATAFYDAQAKKRVAGHATRASAPARPAGAARPAPGGEDQESSAEPSGEAPATSEETP